MRHSLWELVMQGSFFSTEWFFEGVMPLAVGSKIRITEYRFDHNLNKYEAKCVYELNTNIKFIVSNPSRFFRLPWQHSEVIGFIKEICVEQSRTLFYLVTNLDLVPDNDFDEGGLSS